MITMGVEGLSTILLSATHKSRLRKRVTEKLAAVAAPVVEEIREAAPERSGALRDSVRLERDPSRIRVVIAAGGTPETERPTKGGTTYDEALLVEFGIVHEPPNPFFYPAIDAHQSDFEKVADEAVSEAFED